MVIFSDLAIEIGTSVSQPIRCESDDLMYGWVLYLMLDITTCLLLLDNLHGYRGPTTVKLAHCLHPTLGAWALGGSSQGLHCLVEVSPTCPAPINSPESSMMSGEAGWTVRGAHLHHALGTSQVVLCVLYACIHVSLMCVQLLLLHNVPVVLCLSVGTHLYACLPSLE